MFVGYRGEFNDRSWELNVGCDVDVRVRTFDLLAWHSHGVDNSTEYFLPFHYELFY